MISISVDVSNQSTLFRYLLADEWDERQEGTRKQTPNVNVQLARHHAERVRTACWEGYVGERNARTKYAPK
jgi:hypothetical protein